MLMTKETVGKNPGGEGKRGTRAYNGAVIERL